MPKGPQGQKRPADAIGLAVMIGKIATGESCENRQAPLFTRVNMVYGTTHKNRLYCES
jgi:hypothetical protein